MRSALTRTVAISSMLVFAACADDDKSGNVPQNDVGETDVDAGSTDVADDTELADTDTTDQPDAPDGSGEPVSACESIEYPLRPSTDVEVIFDELGIAHIYADNRIDLVWAQGYEAARARLFQMDHNRRMAYGRRAEIFGEAFVQSDRTQRSFRIHHIASERWERNCELHPEAAAIAAAYAAGVNAYIADMQAGANGATRTADLDRIDPTYVPEPWSPVDTLALGQLLIMSQNFQAEQEIAAFAGRTLMGEERFSDLFPLAPMNATYITELEPTSDDEISLAPPLAAKRRDVGEAIDQVLGLDALNPIQRLELGTALLGLAEALGDASLGGAYGLSGGSNSWAVAGSHTSDGRTVVCNDPHMPTELPSRLFPVHLVDRSVSSTGAYGHNMAGIPLLLLGTNGQVAWGLTNPFIDLTDIYREYFTADEQGVQFNGTPTPLDIRDEVIRVRQADGGLDDITEIPIQVRWVPHHGPILNDILPPELGTTLANLNYYFSAQWTGFRSNTDEFSALIALFDAATMDEQIEALRVFNAGAMSWTLADSEGRVGYIAAGPFPVRTLSTQEQVPLGPYDGRGGAEWDGFYPFEDVPSLLEPEKGYIVTANNYITANNLDGDPGNDGFYVQHFADLGTRAHRITDRIEELIAADDANLETLRELQNDVYSVYAEYYVPSLLALEDRACADAESTLCEAFSTLVGWDYHLDDSPAASVFNVWMQYVWFRAAADDVPSLLLGLVGRDMDATIGRAIGHWLAGRNPASGDEYWDDNETADIVETRDDILIDALTITVDVLTTYFGSEDVSTWSWAQIHRAVHRHPVWSDLNAAPLAKPGGHGTVDAADWRVLGADGAPTLPPFDQVEGPVFRFCTALAEGEAPEVRSVLSTGTSAHSDDPAFLDQHADWGAYEHYSIAIERAAVEAAAVETITIAAGD